MFGGTRRSLAFARDDKGEGVTFIGSRLIEWTEKKLLVPASLRSHGRPGLVRWTPALRAWINLLSASAGPIGCRHLVRPNYFKISDSRRAAVAWHGW